MTPDDVPARIDRLCEVLTADGVLHDPAWREAFHAVPRHRFVPDRAWASPNGPGPGYPIDRDADPDQWWAVSPACSGPLAAAVFGGVAQRSGSGC